MPLYADAVDNLLKTKIVLAGDQYNKILFKTAEVPTDGSIFGGYAVFTNGDVIALTSHQGAFDSEAQTFPDSSGRISTLDPGDITFGLCNETQIEEGSAVQNGMDI